MFGPTLLVSPVTTERATERQLYLPAGNYWIDFWSGKRVRGGRTITAEAPLDRIPIFAKAGSILALGSPAESSTAKADPIDLRIYTGANADFTLYEDEGDNYDYEHGAYSEIPIHWDDKANRLTIGNRRGSFPGMLKRRTFRVVIVRDGLGRGMALSSEPDATVEYQGRATSVRVGRRL